MIKDITVLLTKEITPERETYIKNCNNSLHEHGMVVGNIEKGKVDFYAYLNIRGLTLDTESDEKITVNLFTVYGKSVFTFAQEHEDIALAYKRAIEMNILECYG